MQLKAFNNKGIAAFTEYLDALRLDPARPVPTDLLDKPTLTRPLDEPIEATPQPFATRMDFACWLHDAADESNATVPLKDAGFWAWLTLALFDQVCPANAKGQRTVKELPRYIPQLDSSRRYYRHAFVGAYMVFQHFEEKPEIAAPLLCGSLVKLHDEAYRLFVENQLLVHAPAVETLRIFYYDPLADRIRRGAQGKNTPGSIRRFVKLLSQYARTYDLDSLPADQLSGMLPKEFDRWRQYQTILSA